MQRMLIAAAAAALLAAPSASAQGSTAVLYGRVGLGMEYLDGARLAPGVTQPATCSQTAYTARTCTTTDSGTARLSSNGSRFGLRGTESLGGDHSVYFQLESSVSADAGGGTIAGRDTFLGFEGPYGRIQFGRFHAPYDTIVTNIWGNNPTLWTSIMSTDALWAQGALAKSNGGFDERLSNSVRWNSPNWAGFQLQFQYGMGGGPTGTEGTPAKNSGVLSGGAIYRSGPFSVGGAFQQNKEYRGVGLDDLAWSIAGSWQFSSVRIGAVYERLDYDFSYSAATGATTSLTRDFYGIDVTINIGPGQLYVTYGQAGDGGGSAPINSRIGGLARGADSGADHYGVSYTYPLSRRTTIWAGYVKVANEANASYNFGANPYGGVVIGGKPQGITLGAWHNF